MPQFSNFSQILPEPSINWGLAGEENAVTGLPGPGFAGISEDSVDPIMRSKFNSSILDRASNYFHKWTFSIEYNSLLRNEFDTIFSFLLHRNVTLEPFFISIPQYSGQLNPNIITISAKVIGDSMLDIDSSSVDIGNVFFIQGGTKVYKIVRVETQSDHNTNIGSPEPWESRIHIVPPLQQDAPSNSTLIFTNMLFRVKQQGDISYTLNSRNLYSFKLQVEEV